MKNLSTLSCPHPPPPTARLCQHHRDGHPQVPKGEEPPQSEKGEVYLLLFILLLPQPVHLMTCNPVLPSSYLNSSKIYHFNR